MAFLSLVQSKIFGQLLDEFPYDESVGDPLTITYNPQDEPHQTSRSNSHFTNTSVYNNTPQIVALMGARYHDSVCMQLKAQLSLNTVWLTMCSSDWQKLTQSHDAQPSLASWVCTEDKLSCFDNMAFPLPLPSGQFYFMVMSIRAHYRSLELLLFHFRIPCCSPVLPWNLIFWSCGDFF